MVLELKNKLTNRFGVKYQISQKRAYPFSSGQPSGELLASIGLDYEL
jgi:hypothetical protein